MNSIPKHLDFFSDADRVRFVQLVEQSVWLSRHEKKLFLEEGEKSVPKYLVELVWAAIQEETEFFSKMRKDDPDMYDYLEKLRAWFSSSDKKLDNFPGFLDRKLTFLEKPEDEKPKQEPKDTSKPKTQSDFLMSLKLINSVEDSLVNWEFEDAIRSIKKEIRKQPNAFPLYDFLMLGYKALGKLTLSEIEEILTDNGQALGTTLHSVISLNYQIETFDKLDSSKLLDDLQKFQVENEDEYAYCYSYLLSKYYLFVSDNVDDSVKVSFAKKAHDEVSDKYSLESAFTFNHLIKTLIYSDHFNEVHSLLEDIQTKIPPIENFPRFDYFKNLFVFRFAKAVTPENKNNATNMLQKVQDFYFKQFRNVGSDIRTAINEEEFEKAQNLLNHAFIREKSQNEHLDLMNLQFVLLSKQGQLENRKERYKRLYANDKSVANAYFYLKALFELGPDYHYEALQLAYKLRKQNYFIPHFQNIILKIYRESPNFFEKKSEKPLQTANALLALGPSRPALDFLHSIKPELKSENVSKSTETIGTFGIAQLSPLAKYIKISPHSLQFDEKDFLRLLAGSVSLTLNEKKKILQALSIFSQEQIDGLIGILKEEKNKFSELDIQHKQQLETLEKKHASEWERLCFQYFLDSFSKEELNRKYEYLKWLEEIENLIATSETPVENVIKILQQEISQHPQSFFLYELFIQVKKSFGTLVEFKEIETLLRKHKQPVFGTLHKVLLLSFRFATTEGRNDSLLEELQLLQSEESEYTYCRPYLLSKYSDNNSDINSVIQLIFEAISLINDDISFAFLFHYLLKACVAADAQEEITFFYNEFNSRLTEDKELEYVIPKDHLVETKDDMSTTNGNGAEKSEENLTTRDSSIDATEIESTSTDISVRPTFDKNLKDILQHIPKGFDEPQNSEIIGSFGVSKLTPFSQYIKIAPHSLQFDEKQLLLLLAGSVSLTWKEKYKILKAIPRMIQQQIDGLVDILEEERSKFSDLDIQHKQQLDALEKKHAYDWEKVCFLYFLDYFSKQELTRKYKCLKWIQSLIGTSEEAKENAILVLKQEVSKYPHIFFLYELFIQLKKSYGELEFKEVEDLLTKHTQFLFGDPLYKLILLSFSLENMHKGSNNLILLKELESLPNEGNYAYCRPYLLSKYYLINRQPDIYLIIKLILETLRLVDDDISFAFIFDHLIKVCMSVNASKEATFFYEEFQKRLTDKELTTTTDDANKTDNVVMPTESPAIPTDVDRTKVIGSFGVSKLTPLSKYVKIPSHNLQLDERYFLTLLAGSVSLQIDEKKQIIEAIPRLTQLQIDELIRILNEEKDQFSGLEIQHKPQLEELEKKHANEWEQLCFQFLLDTLADKSFIHDYLVLIHNIENLITKFEFESAIQILEAEIAKNPSVFFLYELLMQVKKALGQLNKEEFETLLVKHKQPISGPLHKAILLNLRFELQAADSTQDLLEELNSITIESEYKYCSSYFLSKYYLFLDNETDSSLAINKAYEALGLIDDNISFAFLFNHLIKACIYAAKYELAQSYIEEYNRKILTSGETKKDKLPRFQYLNALCSLLQASIDSTACQYVLRRALYEYGGDIDHSSETLESTEKAEALWVVVQDMIMAVSELGWLDKGEDQTIRDIESAIGFGNISKAEILLEKALVEEVERGKRYLKLMDLKFSLLNVQGKLNTEEKIYRAFYEKEPTVVNASLYLSLLYELNDFNRQYRDDTLALAERLNKEMYFIPDFHNYIFQIHHYLFTSEKFHVEAKNAIQRSFSIGPSHGFKVYVDFFRWKDMYFNSSIFGILEGLTDFGNFSSTIIFALKFNWHEIGLQYFLLSEKRRPYDDEPYNSFAIGLEDKYSLFQIIAATESLQRAISLNVVFLSNVSSDFVRLSKSMNALWHWSLYKAILSLWVDPYHTWQTYRVLLDSSQQLNLGEFYSASYFLAHDLNAPLIRDSHKEYLKNVLSNFIQQGQLTLKGTENCTYLCNLARTIYSESQYVYDTLKVLEPDYIAFDLLHQVEQKRQQQICSEDEFLAEEGKRLYAEMILEDRYLQYRHPELTSQEKYLQKIRELNKLQTHYPDRPYFRKLEQLANEWKRQGFIMALNSGRIAHNSLKTVEIADEKLKEIIELYVVYLSFFKQNGQQINKKQSSSKEQIEEVLSYNDSPAKESFYIPINNIMDKFSLSLYKIKNSLSNYVESNKVEPDSYLIEKIIVKQMFEEVIRSHAGTDSEMFQSFRTRIRHGWLIASLKDCFARFDLYNEGGSDDLLLTDTMRQRLENLETNILEHFETALRILKEEFRNLIEHLDKEWLWLKDEQHPHGMLDFSIKHFDLDRFFKQYDIRTVPTNILIRDICQQIDQHAQKCFINIKILLEKKVYQPLDQRLNNLKNLLSDTKEQFRTQQGNLTNWGYISNQIQAAQNEFSQRMRDYKAWFDFEELAVRDFTLPEIIQMAWEITTEVDRIKVQHHRVNIPVFQHSQDVDKLCLLGSNFTDLLEVFKILFQNIVYHANPEPENSNYNVSIHLQTQAIWKDGKPIIQCRIASTCVPNVDVTALKSYLFDSDKWPQRLNQKQGTGLATIQETLMHRLQGLQGEIQNISIMTEASPTLEAPVADTAWFIVELVFKIHKFSHSEQASTSEDDAFFTTVSIEDLAQQATQGNFNILIVEDQEPKYRVLARYLQNELFPNSNIVHTWDLETSARLIVKEGVQFDLLILDITLPTDPRPDAPLKSLAGLSLLKIMQIRHLKIPTIIVTQYSNWSSEAQFQTRQFIEHLTQSCQRDFPDHFKGAILFSHTELSWQQELKQTLEGISINKDNIIEIDSEEQIEQLRTHIEDHPDDRDTLRQLANLCLKQAEYYFNPEDYQKTEEYYQAANEYYQRLALDEPQAIDIVRGLTLSYVGLGLDDKAQQYLKEMQKISTDKGNLLTQQMLQGQQQYIKRRRQALREQEINTLLGRIASDVAHQFKTPLQTIKFAVGYANRNLIQKIAQQENLQETSKKLSKVFSSIDEQVKSINKLVEHITKLKRGSTEDKENVDLNQVIQQAIQLQLSSLSNYHIKVDKSELASKLPTVYANAALLEQAFLNLITNAQDALKSITDRARQIKISSKTLIREGQEFIMIEFSDNGTGIAKEIRSKLFKPFVTTKQRGQGLGLGLHIVSETFSELGGSIRLDNINVVGACFIIEIPLIYQPATEKE